MKVKTRRPIGRYKTERKLKKNIECIISPTVKTISCWLQAAPRSAVPKHAIRSTYKMKF